MEINREYLRVIPYLDIEAMGARTLNLMPFWDGAKWHLWVPGPDGLIEMKVVEIVQMDYVAKEAASESDVIIPFVELMWQHASWPPIYRVISAISEDFHNLSTSIEKMTLFFERRNDIEDVAPFVKTEVEYMIILSRGVFDLLQEAIAWIWGNAVRLLDEKAEARHKQVKLPRKFSRMVLSNSNIRGPNDLINAYSIPPAMAKTYTDVAPFFAKVRSLRDEIVHLGKDPKMLFVTERGFCISSSALGFGTEPFWRPEHRYNENVVSILPLLARVVLGTIEACGELMVSFAKEIRLPPAIAPGYRVFVRAYSRFKFPKSLRNV